MIAGEIALYGIIIGILILYIKLGKENIMKLKENIVFQIILIILFAISLSYLYDFTREIPNNLALKLSEGIENILKSIEWFIRFLVGSLSYSFEDVVGWKGIYIFLNLVWLCIIFIFIYKYINDNNSKKRNHSYY